LISTFYKVDFYTLLSTCNEVTFPVNIHTVSHKEYHPTTNYIFNIFNNSCPIPVIIGTNNAE